MTDKDFQHGEQLEVLTRADVEKAMADLAWLRARVKQAEGRCDEEIAKAKTLLQLEVEPLLEDVELYEKVLEDWAATDRASWGKAKSLKLAGGTLGFRKDPPALRVVGKGGWKGAVERVKRVLGAAFIRTKEEVDRDAVHAAALDKKKLREAGLKLDEGGERFYVETEEVAA